jgi:hypothetical protein
MNRGFIRTSLILAASLLGATVAHGAANGEHCTVGTCCQNATQCSKNAGFCCTQSPLPCANLSCGSLNEQPPADPLLAGSPPAQGLTGLLGPLSADSRRFGVDDLRKLHRPAAKLD